MSVACVVKRHFGLAPPMWWLKCHMMSQFIYLEVITAADMFHICLHPDLHDAFSSGLCSVMPCDKMECDNREGKRQISCWSRFDSDASQTVGWVRFSARRRRLSQAGKLDARAAPRPSMPSSCLPSACMHVLIRALLYLYHHQAFWALHQHKVFTLTCTCRGEIVESVVLLCSGHMPVCFFFCFFLPLSLPLSIHFFHFKAQR